MEKTQKPVILAHFVILQNFGKTSLPLAGMKISEFNHKKLHRVYPRRVVTTVKILECSPTKKINPFFRAARSACGPDRYDTFYYMLQKNGGQNERQKF